LLFEQINRFEQFFISFTMKLKTRFKILLALLIVTFSAIALFTFFSMGKINKLSEIDKQVQQLYSLSLEIRKNESDFFNWDLKNTTYFKTGRSIFSNTLNQNLRKSNEITNQLLTSNFTKRNSLINEIENIQNLNAKYLHLFSIIQRNKYELGFEEWGIIGEMNQSAKDIESIITTQRNSMLKVQLLILRRYEKDYLFKRNFESKSNFDKQLYHIYKTIPNYTSNKSETDKIKNTLKKYGETFNNFVDKDIYTGYWKNEGLMASLETKGNILNQAINTLSLKISNKTKHYINEAKNILLLFILIFASLALFIGFYIFQRIFNLMGGEPEEVAKIAKSIAKGDLQIELPKQANQKGLMKFVGIMAENLKQIISGIYLNSKHISIAIKNYNKTSLIISQTTIQQAAYIEEISARIDKISENTSSNAVNALETKNIYEKSKVEIHKIKDQTALSFVTSNTIAQKLAIINHISKQTKILALNAAVEASRAGREGDGFQVIAEEVKRLAEVSQEAAVEINKLTEQNQTQSKHVTDLVTSILPQIETTSELITRITTASQEQNEDINHVNNSIKYLYDMSQENATAAEEMETNNDELEKQIFALEKMIAYFKVDSNVSTGKKYLSQEKKPKKKKAIKLWKKRA
jgi:methyl-accepting chemotaxis protein